MKRLVCFVLLMLGLQASYSQAVVRHTYDNAGNRNSRSTTTSSTVAQWVVTGSTRCAVNASGVNTGGTERQERDNNPNSSTYNTTRWVLSGYSTTTCPLPPNWANTGNYRCQVDANNDNTGYEEIEQQDINPGSATYGTTQWILGDYNTGSCPLPSTCDYYSCEYYGPEYRCVYGYCEYGYKVYTYSYYDYNTGQYICYYHYEWSDGAWSPDYWEYNYYYCY